MGEVLISKDSESIQIKDSDVPENENFNASHVSDSVLDSDEESNAFHNCSYKLRKPVISSDDEEDIPKVRSKTTEDDGASNHSEEGSTSSPQRATALSRITLPIESDSEEENHLLQPKSGSTLQEPPKKYKYNRAIFDVDDESDDESSKQRLSSPLPEHEISPSMKSEHELEEEKILSIAKNVLSMGKTKSVKPKVSESAARAERQKELTTIRSESQRRVRDGPISLPYHRPKQRTLQDFLDRKKKEILPLPVSRAGLKMSMRNMEVLRQLEIRKKEAAEFYKSDSDEPDSDEEWKPGENHLKAPRESEGEAENSEHDCPETESKTTEQNDGFASETLPPVVANEQEGESNISDGVKECQTPVKDSAAVDDVVHVSCKSSSSQRSNIEMDMDDSVISGADGITETRSGNNEIVLSEVAANPTDDAEVATKSFESDADKPEISKNVFEPTVQDKEVVEQCVPNEEACEMVESVAIATSDQEEEEEICSNLGDSDSWKRREKTSGACEEDESEFLPNLDDDASLLKFPESKKLGCRIETQDLLDEDMPQLMLDDGPDDDGNAFEHLPQNDDSNSMQFATNGRTSREECHPKHDTSSAFPHIQSSSAQSSCTSGRETSSATSTPAPLPPRLSLLVSKLGGSIPANISPAPRLTPGSRQTDMIDLDDDFATPTPRDPGLVDLMDRFARHSAAKRPLNKPEQVTMSVVSKEKDSEGKEQLVASSVVVNLEGERETHQLGECVTPGAKLQRLKDGLRARIHERRVQATKERQMQKNFMETEEVQQESDDPFALPDDEDEAELTESSEGESEPELEDDVELTDEPRAKSKFLDDEAEEDDDEVDEVETEDKLDGEEDEDDAEGDASVEKEESSSDEEEIVVRKPVRKSKKESRKSALVLDSDDEAEASTETTNHVDACSAASPIPVDTLMDPQCSDTGLLGDKDDSDLEALLRQRDSNSEQASVSNLAVPQRRSDDGEEQDLPDTQPVSSPSKTSPGAAMERRRDSSTTRCSSLDDSCSLELQGSCIPAHQPVRSRPKARHTDLSSSAAGQGSSMGLESSSVDLSWCVADNSSSKASNAQFPSSSLLPIADDATDNLTKGEGASQGTFSASQEMRLDFRGLTGSQEQRVDGELPDLLSGRFTGTSVDLPVDEEEGDMGGLTGLCTGQFTGPDALPCSSTATQAPLTDSSPVLGCLPDVSLSLAPIPLPDEVPTPLTQSPADKSGCPELSDTVLLTQVNETQIGIPATSEAQLGPEHDELLDLCSGDFTDVVSEKKRAACKAPLPAGQSKLTHFFTRGSAPIRKKDDDGNSLRGSAAAAVVNTPTVMKELSVPALKSTHRNQMALEDQTETNIKSTGDSLGEGLADCDSSSSDEEDAESDKENDGDAPARKRRRIVLLDDDDDDDNDDDVGQSSNKKKMIKADKTIKDAIVSEADDGSDGDDEEEDDVQPNVLVYDDEENEVPLKCLSFKDREKGGIRADFLENEAELSGSDVDSDEEEREEDDYMDEEEADKEHYDEEQLREQIGQTHIRGELARDQREVRLLQELYLEDGDLHGEGRQRSFRWKNLDRDDDDGARPADDSDDGDAEAEEQESSQWRKERFEREQFLKKTMENEEEEASLVLGLSGQSSTPSLLKTSSIPIVSKRSLQSTATTNPPTKSDNPALPTKNSLVLTNPENPTPTLTSNPLVLARQSSLPSQLSKCGSFLSRGASKLARLASLIKERNDGSQGGAATANASGNFVFQSLTAEEAQLRRRAAAMADTCKAQQKASNKRPAPVQCQNQHKKPRYDVGLNSARSSKSSIFKHL